MQTKASGLEMFLVRVGDAERDACVETLAEHHIQGRLSLEELDRRQRAALTAITAADLAALVADLPVDAVSVRQDHPVSLRDHRHRFDRRKARAASIWLGPPVALVTTSLVVTTNLDYFNEAAIFMGSLATGVVGFVSHWAVSRPKRH